MVCTGPGLHRAGGFLIYNSIFNMTHCKRFGVVGI